ncbi:hypothetical protein M5K25_014941 [Dendrobium thyrsiflorum]|uniref:Uncharacterized protein n=1 Tax=Dendrobium thyrsiflorum TaxID=117978 RepID=A0ABD0UPS1_DENTH
MLEGEKGMPPLEPISKEEMSTGYERRGVDFVRREVDYERRGVDFEKSKDFEEGFGYLLGYVLITWFRIFLGNGKDPVI